MQEKNARELSGLAQPGSFVRPLARSLANWVFVPRPRCFLRERKQTRGDRVRLAYDSGIANESWTRTTGTRRDTPQESRMNRRLAQSAASFRRSESSGKLEYSISGEAPLKKVLQTPRDVSKILLTRTIIRRFYRLTFHALTFFCGQFRR